MNVTEDNKRVDAANIDDAAASASKWETPAVTKLDLETAQQTGIPG